MPRKRKPAAADTAAPAESNQTTAVAVAEAPAPAQVNESPVTDAAKAAPVAEAPTTRAESRQSVQSAPAQTHAPSEDRGWTKPYVALHVCLERGFEMGENRRFKQRVFLFKEKPADEIRTMLKEHGFVYRPLEKAWTIAATFANRVLSDRLAKELAGKMEGISHG